MIFPFFFEREKASYHADTGQFFGEVAYPATMGAVAFEPFGSLAVVKLDTDSFKENDAIAALRSSGFDEDVSYSTLGLRAATTIRISNMVITPKVAAAWQHAFDDMTPDASLAFASTGIGFDVTGGPLAQNSLLVEAGLDLSLSPQPRRSGSPIPANSPASYKTTRSKVASLGCSDGGWARGICGACGVRARSQMSRSATARSRR